MNTYVYPVGLFITFITLLVVISFFVKLIMYVTKKKPFPKKLFITSLIGIVVGFGLIGYTKYFFTFDNLNGEFFRGPVDSPTGKFTANAYYMTYGGAAGGVNVWVEITYNEENKRKTVYYSDAKSNFSMVWKDEDTLYIVNEEPTYPNSSRNIELVIGKDIYHDSGLACRSLLMKNEYETCYQN
ncbi:DUF5412 family protein [Ferdinandcohnia sp. Marseille-Q9671]